MSLKRAKRTLRAPKRDEGREADPYLTKEAPPDRSVCRQCRAVYHNKHWVLDEAIYREILKGNGASTDWTVCPACQKIKDHFPMGVIHLQGGYLQQHKEEILNLIRNEEERARGFNPLERISAIHDFGERVEVETTNEKLAQRIGKRLHRAHHGTVHYKWSGDNKFIRVEWERSLPEKRFS
jgi:NMD protein affecting ribosome stability and mRNA decay